MAYRATPGLFAELDYASTNPDDTSYQRFSGSAPRSADGGRKSDYYAMSLGYQVLPGEVVIGPGRTLSGALYVLAGAGSISLAEDDHFMLTYGAGYRVQASEDIALRIDVRNFMLDASFPDAGHNVEINLGAAWSF
jgi:outer membrane beta-barrel protein